MKVWKDASGRWIDKKEFWERLKDGMTKVTPYQQAKVQVISYAPLFVGIIWGLVVTAITSVWWLFTILCGSFCISLVQFFGVFQRYLLLQKVERGFEYNAEETESEHKGY